MYFVTVRWWKLVFFVIFFLIVYDFHEAFGFADGYYDYSRNNNKTLVFGFLQLYSYDTKPIIVLFEKESYYLSNLFFKTYLCNLHI